MRPTQIIETPVDKHKVEIKTYVSGGEMEQIQGVWLGSMEMEIKPGEQTPKMPKIKGSLISQANHKTIEVLVVSIDGKKEDILQGILDMQHKDYQFVIDELNKMTATEKKIPETKT